MKTIVLEGGSNTGKTVTLDLLFEKLRQRSNRVLFLRQLGGDPKDKLSIVEIKEKTIGICSMGDYPSLIPFFSGFLIGRECDIIVIANSCKRIPNCVKEQLGDVLTIKKTEASDRDNLSVLNELMRIIFEISHK